MLSQVRLAAALAAVAVVAREPAASKFRCDYTYLPAVGYHFKLHRIPVDWDTARLQCQLEGATLASPLTADIRSAMVELQRAASRDVFIGIHATFANGVYFSMEGIPLSSIEHTWSEGEPNNLNNAERCLAQAETGQLADQPCSAVKPYICYRKHDKALTFNACGTVDNEYELSLVTGSCYKFHSIPRSWGGGVRACAAEGGHLAVVNSQLEARELRRLFERRRPEDLLGNFWKDVAFVGFHGWQANGDWRTVHDESLSTAGYHQFSEGEPNNMSAGEYCGGLYRSGLLDDLWCGTPAAFFCERRPSGDCEDKELDAH